MLGMGFDDVASTSPSNNSLLPLDKRQSKAANKKKKSSKASLGLGSPPGGLGLGSPRGQRMGRRSSLRGNKSAKQPNQAKQAKQAKQPNQANQAKAKAGGSPKKKLMSALEVCNEIEPSINKGSSEAEIVAWLQWRGLSRVVDKFKEEEIDGHAFFVLNDIDFDRMQLTTGIRKKIFAKTGVVSVVTNLPDDATLLPTTKKRRTSNPFDMLPFHVNFPDINLMFGETSSKDNRLTLNAESHGPITPAKQALINGQQTQTNDKTLSSRDSIMVSTGSPISSPLGSPTRGSSTAQSTSALVGVNVPLDPALFEEMCDDFFANRPSTPVWVRATRKRAVLPRDPEPKQEAPQAQVPEIDMKSAILAAIGGILFLVFGYIFGLYKL